MGLQLQYSDGVLGHIECEALTDGAKVLCVRYHRLAVFHAAAEAGCHAHEGGTLSGCRPSESCRSGIVGVARVIVRITLVLDGSVV